MHEVTNKAMEFYEQYFNTPYVFSKYDQIFVPEFNAGAMENAGLVTFNDHYCFKEDVS
jgi:aminopeptidase N